MNCFHQSEPPAHDRRMSSTVLHNSFLLLKAVAITPKITLLLTITQYVKQDQIPPHHNRKIYMYI